MPNPIALHIRENNVFLTSKIIGRVEFDEGETMRAS